MARIGVQVPLLRHPVVVASRLKAKHRQEVIKTHLSFSLGNSLLPSPSQPLPPPLLNLLQPVLLNLQNPARARLVVGRALALDEFVEGVALFD